MCLGGGVSGNPLSGAISVFQFDDVSAVVALCPHTVGGGRGSEAGAHQGTMNTADTSVQSESHLSLHSNNVSL